MFTRFSMLVLWSCLVFTASVFAENREELKARCEQYAQEDNIPAEEMEQYMTDCVSELTEESPEEYEESPEEYSEESSSSG
jgi:hypothetical protein